MDEVGKKDKIKRIFCIVSVLIVIVIIVFLIITVWFIINSGYWTEVEFKNESGEEIRITPIGMVDGTNEIGPLYIKKEFYESEAQNKRFKLKDDDSIKLQFHSSDQNLQFVIVEFSNDDIRILKIDSDFWENKSYQGGYFAPKKDKYSIPPKVELPDCPEVLKACINGTYVYVIPEIREILIEL